MMTRATVGLGWMTLLVLTGCQDLKDPGFDNYVPDTTPDQPDDSTPVDDSSTTDDSQIIDTHPPDDTGTPTTGSLDEPGDAASDVAATEPDLTIDLTDASGDSNQNQEFYLIVTNTAAAESGFQVRYQPATAAPTPPPAAAPQKARPAHLPRHGSPSPQIPPPTLESTDIGTTHREFLVRSSLQNDLLYAPVLATLWALGDNVAIWVDDDVAIDWDIECDGVIDIRSSRDSFGFDNCDLNITADIIDTNIIPNTRALFGSESDIDGDGKVSVVITPQLNSITRTSDDEEDWSEVLSSYAEPEVDLADFDERTNPGSDEGEVIYVFAPDPYGYANRDAPVTIDSYNSYQVAAEVARSFTALISYNQHVLINDAGVQESWLNDAMGTLAADLCGFGASYYANVWEYLDAPHLYPLVTSSTDPLASLDRGAQYLFARWLYDYAEATGGEGFGAAAFQTIMQSSETGTDAILEGIGETDFGALVLKWQVALLSTDVVGPDGNPLVDPTVYPPYAPSEIISAPPGNPGSHYGANGYQMGINLRGLNTPAANGQTDLPTELPAGEIRLDGPDDYLYTPGFSFFGYTAENYSSQFIKLSGINYDAAEVIIQAVDPGLVTTVIRWTDPVIPDYSIENIFSPSDVNQVVLPALPSDGSIIRGVGEVSNPGSILLITSDGDEAADVNDTDQWLLDLSDRALGQEVDVVVWLDRHFADASGASCPDDPWLAIVPLEDLPIPTVYDTVSTACTGTGAALDFQFPSSMLSYLYDQELLSSQMYPGDTAMDDYCGIPAETATDCSNDWDQDGVLDSDEPAPDNFYEQIRVAQCSHNNNQPPLEPYSASWLDVDELDSNETPTATIAIGAGGQSGASGEEGYVEATLEGGRQYVIVVGAAAGDVGPYEISLRQVL